MQAALPALLAGVWKRPWRAACRAMPSGTLVGLMATGAILLAAVVGAIWLEGRMPGQPEQHLRPSSPGRQPRPVTVPAGRQWPILARPVWTGFRPHGRHHR
jgi:hypothetical protein